MTEKRQIVMNTFANGLAQFAAMLSGLIFMPLLIRSFGLDDYGLYMLAISISSYASLLDFGVGASVVKKIAERKPDTDEDTIGPIISTALPFYLLVGVVAALLLCLLAIGSGTVFRVSADGARLLRNLLLVGAAASVISWPLGLAASVLGGLQRFTLTARTALGVSLGSALVTLLVIISGQGPIALAVGNALVGIIGGVINLSHARRALPRVRVSLRLANKTTLREIISFSWAIFVIQVCVLIIYQQTDRVVLGIFVGASAIALYDAAGKFQGALVQLTSFANSAVMPMASKLQAESRDSALQTLFLRGTRYTLVLINPVVVTLMILAEPLLARWLGDAFAVQAIAAQILISHQLLTSGVTLGDSIIIGLGKLPKRLPNAVGIITLGNLVLSLALVQRYGIMGVVIGTAVPYLVDYPLHLGFLLRELKIPFGRWWGEIAMPTYPLLAVPALISLGLRTTGMMESIGGVLAASVLSVTAYWLAFGLVGLNRLERDELQAFITGMYSRLRRPRG